MGRRTAQHGRRGRPPAAMQRLERLAAGLSDDALANVSTRALAREAHVSIGTAAAFLHRLKSCETSAGPKDQAAPAVSFPDRSTNLDYKNTPCERNNKSSVAATDQNTRSTRQPLTPYDTYRLVKFLAAVGTIVDAVQAGVNEFYLVQGASFLHDVIEGSLQYHGRLSTFIISLSNRTPEQQLEYERLFLTHPHVVAYAYHVPHRDVRNPHFHVVCSQEAASEIRGAVSGSGIVSVYALVRYLQYLQPPLTDPHSMNGGVGRLNWCYYAPRCAVAAWLSLSLDDYTGHPEIWSTANDLAISLVMYGVPRGWPGDQWMTFPHGKSVPNWRILLEADATDRSVRRLHAAGITPTPSIPESLFWQCDPNVARLSETPYAAYLRTREEILKLVQANDKLALADRIRASADRGGSPDVPANSSAELTEGIRSC